MSIDEEIAGYDLAIADIQAYLDGGKTLAKGQFKLRERYCAIGVLYQAAGVEFRAGGMEVVGECTKKMSRRYDGAQFAGVVQVNDNEFSTSRRGLAVIDHLKRRRQIVSDGHSIF